MLTPAAQAQVDAYQARVAARWAGQIPRHATTRPSIDEIEVGCQVWTRTDGDLTHIRARWDGEARGGIVVDVERRHLDDDTVTVYRVIDPNLIGGANPYGAFYADQVDPDRTEPVKIGSLRAAVRAIWRHLGEPAKGPISDRHKQLAADAQRLVAVLDHKDVHR